VDSPTKRGLAAPAGKHYFRGLCGVMSRFAALPRERRRTLMNAFLCVGAVRIGLSILPLRAVRALIPGARGNSHGDPVDGIVWAVTTASRYVPGASCLTQALAAQTLLARSNHQSRLEIGVAKEGERFAAHAWVICGDQIVIGGPDVTRYAPLARWETNG
jgi:Transglutaminase-like superfamily